MKGTNEIATTNCDELAEDLKQIFHSEAKTHHKHNWSKE
jgi:hypothetical protein